MTKDLIFDFETLGQNTMTCPIIDCAYFVFDRDRFVSKNPYTFNELVQRIQHSKVSVEDQVKNHGAKVESSTVDWWSKQGKAARSKIAPKPDDLLLEQFFNEFCDYVKAEGPLDYFWSRSNTFDPVIIWRIAQVLGRQADHDRLLNFWKVRDTRTFIDAMTGFKGKHTNSFIPIEDHNLWHQHFEQHNCIHDVAADILRLQVLTRLYDENCED